MGQVRDNLRFAMKGSIADNRTDAVIKVKYRGKTDIHANGTQFTGHQPAGRFRTMTRMSRIRRVQLAKPGYGRKPGKTFTKALYAPSFLVHRHQQPGLPNLVNGLYKRL
jgi:hypothetical protein